VAAPNVTDANIGTAVTMTVPGTQTSLLDSNVLSSKTPVYTYFVVAKSVISDPNNPDATITIQTGSSNFVTVNW
jgi:hypothetical protein